MDSKLKFHEEAYQILRGKIGGREAVEGKLPLRSAVHRRSPEKLCKISQRTTCHSCRVMGDHGGSRHILPVDHSQRRNQKIVFCSRR